MGAFVCEDFWTGSNHFKKIIETRDIENEGDVTDNDEEENSNIETLDIER
jgi:hypothetical protein